MYEVVVDRVETLDPYEYEKGSSFYFETLRECIDFIDVCFESNDTREFVLIKRIEEK